MKVYFQITELTGFNQSPISGDFILDSGSLFIRAGVIVGIPILYNMETGISGLVTNLTKETITATSVPFKQGQPYIVTLSTPWTITDPDENIPITDIECKWCGFSFPSNKLIEGVCRDCYDPLKRGKN
jgi:hypothetical protein